MPTGTSAQQFLDIENIHEDVVTLKGGALRVVLMCSAMNFALKSSDEQDAIIYQYQNFLNSLDFPLQFVIHSRRFNIAPYLETLKQRMKEEDNELMKIQMNEYTEFIKTFVEMTNIMSKTFYAVVPFTPPAIETRGLIQGVISSVKFWEARSQDSIGSFEERKNQLWQRVDAVVTGLQRIGVRSTPLNTEELIELFYGLYNPTEFEKITAPME